VLCACIDIGSNTTRVLIADVAGGGVRPVLERKAYTELGRDLRATGTVSSGRMEQLARVVAEYRQALERLGVGRVRTVATAALRGAGNREAVRDCVREHARVEVEVLPGEDEARLAFLGATRTLPAVPDGALAVVDVGGGSSEIAVGTVRDGVRWCCSLPVGSGYLAEAHAYGDPPTVAQMDAMREHLRALVDAPGMPRATLAVAVGGSATSLCAMGGSVLDEASLARAARMLCATPAAEVAARFALDLERVRLLPAGVSILTAVVHRLGCALQVGRGGLREGVCLELAGQGAT
jgi:exopolyphosphatase/guanosine-5'-triphosphate,3'-diphosphate pyrophosphatase